MRVSWVRRRVSAVVVGVLVAAGLVATADAAAADTTGPVLTSVSATPSSATTGDVVKVHYSATSSVPLASVRVVYNFGGTAFPFLTEPGAEPALDGTVDVPVPAGARNAPVTLMSVALTDAQGASSGWSRSGMVSYAGGASGPGTHTVPMAPADFAVTGSVEDRASPVIRAVSMDTHAFSPGDTVRLHYDLTDASDLREVRVVFVNTLKGFRVTLSAKTAPVAEAGDLLLAVDDTWANGDYTVESVGAADRWNQASTMFPDGRLSSVPDGWTTGGLDLSGLRFSVSGSPADHEAPELTSVGPVNVVVGRTGTVTIPYAATDASGRLGTISMLLTYNANVFSVSATDVPLTGSVTQKLALPATTALGVYTLQSVTISDPGGSSSAYTLGGVHKVNGVRVAPHTIDLSAVRVTLADRPQPAWNVRAVPGDRKATVSWDLDLGGTNNAPMTGITVTATPSGRSVTVSPSATSATISGLANLTTYTFTVRRNNTLGSSDPVSRKAMPRASGQRLVSPGDFDGDGRYDLVGVDRSGAVHLYRGNGRGHFAAPGKVIARGWQDERMLVGSLGQKGTIRTVNYNGTLVDHYARTASSIGSEWDFSSGWGGMRTVFDVGNWVGDVNPDVMAVRDNGDLYLYQWRGSPAGLYSGVRIGSGWSAFRQVFGVGDVTGDRRNDLIGLRTDGSLWLYAGNGRGGFAAAGRKIATGFSGARAITASYFDEKAGMDLLTVDAKGNLRLYSGSDRARFTYRGVIGTGWTAFL